jgi:hypothetical protein
MARHSALNEAELQYLGERPLARVATIGRAEALAGPRPLIRVHPERVRSWGLDR